MTVIVVPHDGTKVCDLALLAVRDLGPDAQVHVVSPLPGDWSARVHVRAGDLGEALVQVAEEVGATLIVLPPLDEALAQHVIAKAPCAVQRLPAPATRQDQVDVVCEDLTVRASAGLAFLTAARVEIPAGEDPQWWEQALDQALLARGIEFVDLVVVHGDEPRARVVSAALEDRFV
jgi:hypothetical protein